MYTYQDFMAEGGVTDAVQKLVKDHMNSRDVKIAKDADTYDRRENSTITSYVHYLYSADGVKHMDTTASNNKLCNGYFPKLNTQRVSYSLGNGITFQTDVKDRLGQDFDQKIKDAAYDALIHKVCFIFLNVDHIHVFPFTEFAPLWDEETGALVGGVRYWQIDAEKDVQAVLYEIDGYTRLKASPGATSFEVVEDKRKYKQNLVQAPVDDEPEIVGEENYNALPIIALWGEKRHQSTLVGRKAKLDAYDLISSGFANDLTDCSEIYWIVQNAGGMADDDLAKFRDRLKLHHIANVDNADEVSVTPYTQDVPSASREVFLNRLRSEIYEDFCALDVHTIAAGATNDHIDAAYQPVDDAADDFEYQVIAAIQQLLALIGVEDTPIFKRNRISNQKEQVEMLTMVANYLDEETIIKKLPFITPDEVEDIMKKKDAEEMTAYVASERAQTPNEAIDDEV